MSPSLVDQVIESLSLQAAQKKDNSLTYCRSDPIRCRKVEADQALITQALHNLVENAIKYTPSGGDIRVNVRVLGEPTSSILRFEILALACHRLTNHACSRGSTAQQIVKQSESAEPVSGLAIVKSIAERHGGQCGITEPIRQRQHILHSPYLFGNQNR
jgi:signal transduction histidine kinase